MAAAFFTAFSVTLVASFDLSGPSVFTYKKGRWFFPYPFPRLGAPSALSGRQLCGSVCDWSWEAAGGSPGLW